MDKHIEEGIREALENDEEFTELEHYLVQLYLEQKAINEFVRKVVKIEDLIKEIAYQKGYKDGLKECKD